MENKIPTKQQAQKWANALRSGKYKQGRDRLQTHNLHCCLGVACEIFIPVNKQERSHFGQLFGGTPSIQPHAPIWLKQVNYDLFDRAGDSFTSLNDLGGFTFDMIADIIELVYVHKAL